MADAAVLPEHIRTWVFDLDNTLYPPSSSLFGQVERRMIDFIGRHLRVRPDEAQRLRRGWAAAHGTTLRGLMVEHALDPAAFLEEVHDIDLSVLAADAALDRALAALPGRKLIFTNGTVPYAERVLERLGIARHFDGMLDIVGCGYLPKPDPSGYDLLIRRFGIAPREAAMFEDMARNLVPAHALGMTTVWVRPGGPEVEPPGAHIHHVTDRLADWLSGFTATALRPADPG